MLFICLVLQMGLSDIQYVHMPKPASKG